MISRLFRSFRRPNDLFSFLANEHTPRAEHLATWQRFQLQTLVAAWKKTFGTDIYLHYLKCFQILAKSTLEFLRHPLITVPINTFFTTRLNERQVRSVVFLRLFCYNSHLYKRNNSAKSKTLQTMAGSVHLAFKWRPYVTQKSLRTVLSIRCDNSTTKGLQSGLKHCLLRSSPNLIRRY